jgi:hypothetical protein
MIPIRVAVDGCRGITALTHVSIVSGDKDLDFNLVPPCVLSLLKKNVQPTASRSAPLFVFQDHDPRPRIEVSSAMRSYTQRLLNSGCDFRVSLEDLT